MLLSTCISLWERQKNLVNIQFLPGPDFEELLTRRPAVLTSLKSLKHLHLVPISNSYWDTGTLILISSNKIETLILDLWPYEEDDIRVGRLDDDIHFGVLKMKEFFAPFAVTLLFLTKLELRNIRLHESTHAIISALSLPTLKDLGLYRCAGADVFLTNLSQSKNPPRLHALRISHLRLETTDTIVSAIDAYLIATPSSLRTLTVFLRGSNVQPKASSIVHHGSTLNQLFLDVRTCNHQIYKNNDHALLYPGSQLPIFFSNLPHLTQLAMAFPKVVADGNHLFTKINFKTQLVSIIP